MIWWQWTTEILLLFGFGLCLTKNAWNDLNLPEEHLPYFFTNNPDLKQRCLNDSKCPYKKLLQEQKTTPYWGYEANCSQKEKIDNINCPSDSKGWTKDKFSQKEFFWNGGDFGYIKERKEEFKSFCVPQEKGDSSLECTKYLRYCKAKNIYMDFRKADLKSGYDRYREDLFPENEIGGHCKLDLKSLKAEHEHKSPLQSWFAELGNYSSLKFRPNSKSHCDVTIDKPAFFIKLDMGMSLYHHFCDFINLYVSQHMNNSFSTDVYIVMWDTSAMDYGDLFKVTWQVFSEHKVIPLVQFDGKRVCFKDAIFSFLPRMRYGLYYNMPLVPGCVGSSMVRAFSQHVLHRLNVIQEGPLPEKVRITLLSRSTQYRKILNVDELVSALKTIPEFDVRLIDFDARFISFHEQLKVSLNSDIFIGMHGSGLTHTLFLPDWAVLFELYNCEDEDCYQDLTNLRGVKYITWQNAKKLVQEDEGHHPTLGAHAKFTNYSFDVKEFIRLVLQAADYVLGHPDFWNGYAQKYNPKVKTEL